MVMHVSVVLHSASIWNILISSAVQPSFSPMSFFMYYVDRQGNIRIIIHMVQIGKVGQNDTEVIKQDCRNAMDIKKKKKRRVVSLLSIFLYRTTTFLHTMLVSMYCTVFLCNSNSHIKLTQPVIYVYIVLKRREMRNWMSTFWTQHIYWFLLKTLQDIEH